MGRAPTFYVYTLADPRCGSVFYVGKGKGNRAFAHTKLAKTNGRDCNKRKFEKIRDILASGCEPLVEIVARYEFELDALEHERELISTIDGLTNIMSGYGWRLTKDECLRRANERNARLLARENAKCRDRNFHYIVGVEVILKSMTENGIKFQIDYAPHIDIHAALISAVTHLADKWRRETGINLVGEIR